jgi:hypothetical protein
MIEQQVNGRRLIVRLPILISGLLLLSTGLSSCRQILAELMTDPFQIERKASANDPFRTGRNQTDSAITLLRWAIIGQESGRNFRAVNPHSGALGYAQIMPSNLPRWSQDALGYRISRDQFLQRPDLQLAIIDHKLAQYWKQSLAASRGNEAIAIRRVAAWWYSGNPNLYRSTQPQFYRGYRYPSIAHYSQRVLQKYRVLLSQNPGIAIQGRT